MTFILYKLYITSAKPNVSVRFSFMCLSGVLLKPERPTVIYSYPFCSFFKWFYLLFVSKFSNLLKGEAGIFRHHHTSGPVKKTQPQESESEWEAADVSSSQKCSVLPWESVSSLWWPIIAHCSQTLLFLLTTEWGHLIYRVRDSTSRTAPLPAWKYCWQREREGETRGAFAVKSRLPPSPRCCTALYLELRLWTLGPVPALSCHAL